MLGYTFNFAVLYEMLEIIAGEDTLNFSQFFFILERFRVQISAWSPAILT
jgi:hypothetical protein